MSVIRSRADLLKKMNSCPSKRDQKGPEVEALISDLAALRSHTEIDKHLVYRIAQVKSPRRAALVCDNDNDAIKEALRLAFDTTLIQNEAIRVSILTALQGVEVPTASAILAWREPKKWGVVDFRTWQVCYEAGLVAKRLNSKDQPLDGQRYGRGLTVGDWRDYIAKIKSLASELGWEPQQVDQWMYWWHKDHEDDYPKRSKRAAE